MVELIRITRGQETPAPGRWTIAPGQPVAVRTGSWWRARRTAGRVTAGGLLINQDGAMAFRIAVELATAGSYPTALTYQSIQVQPIRDQGIWRVAGEIIGQGRVHPAHSRLYYRGVFRGAPGAIAWLSWHLPRTQIPGADRDVNRRLELSADLNVDAPQELCEPKNRNEHPVRTTAWPAAPPNALPKFRNQETRSP